MKILIADNKEKIVVVKELDNMDAGLIGQTITELELLIDELKEKYKNG